MIDIKFLRENPDVVKQNIKNKFQDSKLPLVDEVIELDAQARATQQEADDLRANRNKLSKQIGALMAQGKKEEAEKYLNRFSEKSGIEKKYIQKWIPIVAATQMTKGKAEEQEFLSKWIDIVEYQ